MNLPKFRVLGFCRLLASYRPAAWLTSLCILCVLCVSVVNKSRAALTTETLRTQRLHRELQFMATPTQGPGLDYSSFKHTSQRHASLDCNSCHQRKDNSATPSFPGHKACLGCHTGQFVTPGVAMCAICHSGLDSANPPMKGFPTRFNESFNVKFDHAQHMTGSARPAGGCSGCHARSGRGAVAMSIPAGIAAHNHCYTCHTPSSKSQSGREIASCGVCHDQQRYSRTSTNARSFRYAFSHAEHGARQRLDCADCHSLRAGLPQARQVTSPLPLEHFVATGAKTCLTCHDGRRSFGGDVAFDDCRRCHTAATFKMPL